MILQATCLNILSQLSTHCGPCFCFNYSSVCTILKIVPTFDSNNFENITEIILNVMGIKSVDDNAFINFQNNNISYINLDDNEIATISDDAFVDVENIIPLGLNRNRLSFLPDALLKLGHLQDFQIVNNPLLSLDTNIMSTLGNTVTSFSYGMTGKSQWPTEIRSLRHLQSLFVSDLNETHLSKEMFQGFQNSLLSLKVEVTPLQTIPSTICDLPNLQNLTIEYALSLNESNKPVFEPCKGRLSPVKYFSLIYTSNLTAFPDLRHTFSSVQILDFNYNRLKHMSANRVAHVQLVTTLIATHNLFTSVPDAINQFTNLVSLNLGANIITNINDQDFEHLTKFKYFYLYANPKAFISNNAFQNNLALETLNLAKSHIRTLPPSMKLLRNLQNLSVRLTLLECTCQLANLKGWNVSMITLDEYDNVTSQVF